MSKKKQDMYISYLFWSARNKKKYVLKDEQEIVAINRLNYQGDVNLFNISEIIDSPTRVYSGNQVKGLLARFYNYDYKAWVKEDNQTLMYSEYCGIIRNMNINWHNNNSFEVKYGIINERVNLRAYPTSYKVGNYKGDNIDRFQESALYFGEIVIILNESMDSKWFLSISRDYIGWIEKKKVSLINKEKIKSYLQGVRIIAKGNMRVKTCAKNFEVPLGSELFVKDFRKGYKELYLSGFKSNKIILDSKQQFDTSYEELKVENIFKVAFRILNEPYAWGGKNGNRDCSSFVRDVYRVFGLELPRNASEQLKMDGVKVIDVSEYDSVKKLSILDEVGIGMPIYMKGHVMIYLGSYKETGFIIHDSLAFYNEEKVVGGGKIQVSSLEVCTSNNMKYIDEISWIINFE